ncbi:MAG: ATP-binding protein [Candidatus Omnitrophota bacterium]
MFRIKLKFGLAAKFIITVTILLIVTISILGLYFINHERGIINEDLKERGLSLADNLAYNSEYGMLTANIDILSTLVAGVMKQPDVAYCIIQDLDGKQLVYKWQKNKLAIPGEINNRAKEVKEPAIQYFVIPGAQGYYDFSIPVKAKVEIPTKGEEVFFQKEYQDKEKKLGVVRIGVSLARVGTLFRQAQQAIIFIMISIVLAAGIVVVLLTEAVLAPIKKLVEATQRIASGDLTFKVSVRTQDEIGALAGSFNKMIGDLQKVTVSRDELAEEISERKRMEEALRNSEERFRFVAESISDFIYEWDIATGNLKWHGDIDKELGYAPGKFPRTIEGWEKSIHPDDSSRVLQALEEHLKMHKPYREEYRILRKDTSIIYWVDSGTALRDASDKPYKMIGSCSNITARKKAEEEREDLIKELEEREESLNRQKKEAEDSRRAIKNVAEDLRRSKEALQAQKGSLEDINKELDDFTYIISHDLKEPLRSIDAFSKFIVDDYDDRLDEQGRFYIERVRMNASRMQKLIEDLLEISRLERKKNIFEEVEATELIDEVKLRLEYRIEEKNAQIITKDKLPRVYCDRIRLTEVFANLFSNALKFNDKPNPQIEIGSKPKDGFNEFYVKDNGPGIEEQYFDKVFDIFQRLGKREDNEGTGAGLTIVKKIVHMHKGRIWLESKIGEFTTFYFTIPTKEKLMSGLEKKKIGEILVEKRFVTEEQIIKALGEQGSI